MLARSVEFDRAGHRGAGAPECVKLIDLDGTLLQMNPVGPAS